MDAAWFTACVTAEQLGAAAMLQAGGGMVGRIPSGPQFHPLLYLPSLYNLLPLSVGAPSPCRGALGRVGRAHRGCLC